MTDSFLRTLRDWIEVFMHRSMSSVIRFSKAKGLSMSQIGALFHIDKGVRCVSDLGDDLGVTSASASQMLERMVQQGLILRFEDPQDRRFKQIVLTDEGRRTVQESLHARQGWLDDLALTLSANEKEQIAVALKILIDKANQLEPRLETVVDGPSSP
ncbi:MAG: MarR family transcriptional regulator [bacterium]